MAHANFTNTTNTWAAKKILKSLTAKVLKPHVPKQTINNFCTHTQKALQPTGCGVFYYQKVLHNKKLCVSLRSINSTRYK